MYELYTFRKLQWRQINQEKNGQSRKRFDTNVYVIISNQKFMSKRLGNKDGGSDYPW